MPDSARGAHRINVPLDEEHAARLRRMADQSHTDGETLARSLLSREAEQSLEPLETFPLLGRALEGGGNDGLTFVVGPLALCTSTTSRVI